MHLFDRNNQSTTTEHINAVVANMSEDEVNTRYDELNIEADELTKDIDFSQWSNPPCKFSYLSDDKVHERHQLWLRIQSFAANYDAQAKYRILIRIAKRKARIAARKNINKKQPNEVISCQIQMFG